MTDEKDLGKALKEEQESITIEGDLKEKVIKIKVTGKVAWMFCISALTVSVGAILVTLGSGGTAAPASAFVGAPALAGTVAILGVPAATSAIGIAVAGGGVGTLNKLRKYRVEKVSDNKIILHKK